MSHNSEVKITNLTCEYNHSPLGIEVENPRFSWMLKSGINGQKQTSYRILVADDLALLTPKRANVWDSKVVPGNQSVFVSYQGKPLKSATKYWWKVMIWDKDSLPTEWSAPSVFETGLLNDEDWGEAKWITLESDTRGSNYRFREMKTERMQEALVTTSYPSPLFRKEMNVRPNLKSARAYISGLGYYELYLNGEKTGDQVLDPAQTTYDVYSKYVIHDISGQLSEGSNAIGVVLGNGFYGQNVAFHPTALDYGTPRLKALFRLEYEDGTIQEIITDERWKAACGPIVFNNVFAGETYDARYEISGWDLPGFNDSLWLDAKIGNAPTARLAAQKLPPIRKKETLKPVDIFLSGNKWIVDFGQNISGWVKIKVSEEPGTVIQIRMAEALTRDGKELDTYSTGHFATGVEQIDVYICNGQEKEEWEPRFTYHGFQFAEISGLTKKPDNNSIEAVWVYSDVEETGKFSSSDPMLNKMHEVSINTIKGNIHGLPEDCPHREKCGWLGDAHISAEACIYNFDMALFFDKFINDIISTLGRGNPDNRLVPTMVAPGKRLGGNATMDWGVAIVMLPWYMYNYYGDIKPFMNNYAHIKEFISYMTTYINEHGIIENGLGDWCPPLWDRRDNPSAMLCHPYISSTAFLYKTFKIMEFMAIRLNDPSYSEWANKEAEKIKEAFNAQFLVPIDSTPYKWYGSQTATVLAFKYGMVPGEIRKKVAESLKYDIEVTHNGHHTSGIFGLRHIYTVLNDLGYNSLAMHILTVSTFPSQAYIINSGLNTWPERQWEWDSGIEWDRSLNHLMQAGFSAWFHESLAGIQPDPQTPGFKHFILKPQPPESLDWVKADMRSMYGMISSKWENNNESFQWEINIPANSSATVFIPAGEINISAISGNKKISGQEVTYLRNEDDYLVYKFESGAYLISSLSN